MRAWLRTIGLALIGLALALNVALLAYGDPAALPGPLGQVATEQVVPWAQDNILPWLLPLGLFRADDAIAAPPDVASEPEPTPEPASSPSPSSVSIAPSPTAQEVVTTATPAPQTLASPVPTPSPTQRVVAAPARLLAPSIGLDAPVVKAGVDKSGAMTTPYTAYEVGWYGPHPGEPGNALFTGHVDWVVEGKVTKGSFYLLQKLEPGALLTVRAADGTSEVFKVAWTRYFDAASAPVEEITGPTAVPSITLITCGGLFDRSLKTYLGRWVVRATRVEN